MFAAAASDFKPSELDFKQPGANGVEITRLDINLHNPKTPLDVYIKFTEAKIK